MAVVERQVAAVPAAVWGVLADGWQYPAWVVGAARMRAVEPEWPQAGSRLHHSVGSWPLLLNDSTEVLEAVPGQLLRLRARGWPFGEAVIELRLHPLGDDACRVSMAEVPAAGPGRALFNRATDSLIAIRNAETLRRLASLVERRTRPATPA